VSDERAPHELPTTVTYLEMHAPPAWLAQGAPRPPRDALRVVRAVRPTAAFYRFLYGTVGGPWTWVDRKKLADDALLAIVQDPRVEVHVLHDDGVPAGYVELDARAEPEIEVAYFGLVPERIGQGLGSYLLRWAVARAWERSPTRLWVHTCTLDHPGALPLYERVGFTRYATATEIVDTRVG
jgi:GNAT superfamily N-acetyltransferase